MSAPASPPASTPSKEPKEPKQSKLSARLWAAGIILFMVATGGFVIFTRNSSSSATISPTVAPTAAPATKTALMRTILPASASPAAEPTVMVVYVTGAVAAPGVYRLLPGERVSDAIDAAGGMTADADAERVEMAQRVRDEMHIIVPRKGQTAAVPAQSATPKVPKPTSNTPKNESLVNVNSATQAELEALPGIGATLAARLVEYRASHSPFRTLDDLRQIRGYNDHVINLIKDRVTF